MKPVVWQIYSNTLIMKALKIYVDRKCTYLRQEVYSDMTGSLTVHVRAAVIGSRNYSFSIGNALSFSFSFLKKSKLCAFKEIQFV